MCQLGTINHEYKKVFNLQTWQRLLLTGACYKKSLFLDFEFNSKINTSFVVHRIHFKIQHSNCILKMLFVNGLHSVRALCQLLTYNLNWKKFINISFLVHDLARSTLASYAEENCCLFWLFRYLGFKMADLAVHSQDFFGDNQLIQPCHEKSLLQAHGSSTTNGQCLKSVGASFAKKRNTLKKIHRLLPHQWCSGFKAFLLSIQVSFCQHFFFLDKKVLIRLPKK